MENFKNRLSSDLKAALKQRNQPAVKTIRNLISAIDNAGAIKIEQTEEMPMSGGIAGAKDGLGSTEAQRKELTEADVHEIIRKEISELTEAMNIVKHHTDFETEKYFEQIAMLEKYLL